MFGSIRNWWQRFRFQSALDREAMRRQAEQAAAQAEAHFCNVGLSVGQGQQPTGLAILDKYRPPRGPDGRRRAQYVCRYLRRWQPPDTAYPALAGDLQMITDAPAVAGCDLLVESGTSTRGTVRYLWGHSLRAHLRPMEVRVHGSDQVRQGAWQVGKGTLIETTRQVLQENRLYFDEQMPPEVRAYTPSVPTVYHALLSYPYHQGPAANEAFAAREGEYDDLVLAIAMACWYGEFCQRPLNIWV